MKKILLLITVVVLVVSCKRTTNEPSGDSYVRFYRDPITNVEYVLFYTAYGSAITPRLNSDGTPYVNNIVINSGVYKPEFEKKNKNNTYE